MSGMLPAALLLLFAGVAPGGQEETFERADELARRVAEADVAVGFAVGIAIDGRTFVRGYGETERGGGTAPDGRTLYEIGSITKVFTGVLLADAVGLGRATVDDEVNAHLPGEVRLGSPEDPPVLLRHLAAHTSGLPRMPGSWASEEPHQPYLGYDVERLYTTVTRVELMSPPGTKYAYSNLGVGLLGHLLERACETPYEELLRRRILAPLELDDTAITLSAEQRERLAPPYDPDRRPEHEWQFGVLAPCGALRSTVDDLLAFSRATIDPPDAPVGVALRRSLEPLSGPEVDTRVGYGWHLEDDGRVLYHNGRTGGYAASLAVHLERRAALVLLTNSPGTEVASLATQLFRLVSGDEPGELVLRVPASLDREVLARYEGKYRFAPFQELTVVLEDDGLFASMTFQPALGIYPASETEFYYRAVDATLTFELDEEGVPAAVVLRQASVDRRAARVE